VGSNETRILLGKPGSPLGLGRVLRLGCSRAGTEPVIRLGFAYVSSSGLDTLLSEVSDVQNWRDSQKEWIVGLHHGITEPNALERICALSNCSVKVFAGANRLSMTSLAIGELFHAKLIWLTSGSIRRRRPICLLTSSANMTGAALGAEARNYEAGVALFGATVPSTQLVALEKWWIEAKSASLKVTDAVLDQYARLRSVFLQRNPDTLAGVDPPSLTQLRSSKTLWIEAGAMSGGSRNQVEFNRELAAFFGRVTHGTRLLRITANGKEWDDRPVAHKVTTFGVDIWRLSLPTVSGGGFEYPGTVIRFDKAMDRNGEYFDVSVAAPSDRGPTQWRAAAHRHGYVGLTSGHRSFGFFRSW
jgi:hypothetical protein